MLIFRVKILKCWQYYLLQNSNNLLLSFLLEKVVDPLIEQRRYVFFGILVIENEEAWQGMWINESIDDGNVQYYCNFRLRNSKEVIEVKEFFKSKEETGCNVLDVKYAFLFTALFG